MVGVKLLTLTGRLLGASFGMSFCHMLIHVFNLGVALWTISHKSN